MTMLTSNIVSAKPFTFGSGKTWAEVAADTTAEQTVDAPGVTKGDFVFVRKPTHQAGLDYNSLARATADNVLAIRFSTPDSTALTPTAEETWEGLLFRPELPLPEDASN